MARYRLIGGPCDGQYGPDVATEPTTGATIACGGATYRYTRDNPHVWLWLDTGPPSGGGGVGTVPGQRQVYAQWTKAMRALAVTMPKHVRATANARARIKRVVK